MFDQNELERDDDHDAHKTDSEKHILVWQKVIMQCTMLY
jgi:hypothetical protein